MPLPPDLLANRGTALARAFESARVSDRFGVEEFYRVASGPATGSALYLAVLSDWGQRSSSRDRARRRVAKAVVQNTADTRSLILLVPNNLARGINREIEIVMPRLRERANSQEISTIRALVSTAEPSRFHLDLLKELAAARGDSLVALAARWRKAFSVERVTREFYQAYADVRDRIVDALVAANPDHQWVLATANAADGDARRREWATRQLGRVLFLWFLQSKRWLGYDGGGEGSPTYLVDLWNRRRDSGKSFWRGMLQPLFFKAMAEARPAAEVTTLLGNVPFLNGGLFRNSALEDEVDDAGEPLELPDDVFEPSIPEGAPQTVLSLLSRYRFTTRESTPDDQSVDPDPELLGRVFENLYQGDERHDTGTYYTPREIVHFMCRQGLDGYLRDATGVDQEALDWLRREVTDPEDSARVIDPDLRERIEEALERVRICDPAVGSGAFLLGSMQEMVRLRRGMAHAANEYDAVIDERVEDWKRRAIEHSLYGVDINPEAVEICQLRLWLSLVLDYQGHPREVRPLPNLDFRIRIGDSLIDRFEDVAFVESRPAGSYQAPFELVGKLDGEHEKIERWLAEYEHATPSRQREIRELIQKAKVRVLKAQVTAQRDEAASKIAAAPAQSSAARTRQARAAKKAEQALASYEEALRTLEDIEAQRPRIEKPFLWPLAFPEVFEDGGFDLVFANPPYVRRQSLTPQERALFEPVFPDLFQKNADLYVFFYGRALHLLKRDGRLAYLTPNKFFRVDYGSGLRPLLGSQTTIEAIVDFGHLPVFDADVMPTVVIVANRRPSAAASFPFARLREPLRSRIVTDGRRVNVENVREELEDLEQLLAAESMDIAQEDLTPSSWSFMRRSERALLDLMRVRGRPVGEVLGPVYHGINSGLNQAFVLDAHDAQRFMEQQPEARRFVRPLLRGQDIQRWRTRMPDKFIIAIRHSGDDGVDHPWAEATSEREAEDIFAGAFPGLHHHLSQFQEPLARRTSRGKFWWELRPCSYFREFGTAHLAWTDLAYQPEFAWNTSGVVLANTCLFAPHAPLYLMVLMNSVAFEWAASWALGEGKDAYYRWLPSDLTYVPIPDVSEGEIVRIEGELKALLESGDAAEIDAFSDETAAEFLALKSSDRELISNWKAERQANATVGSLLEADEHE